MRRLSRVRLWSLVVLVVFAAGTLGASSAGAVSSPAAKAKKGVDPSKPVRIAMSGGTVNFDVHKNATSSINIMEAGGIYDRLVRLNHKNEVEPMLATKWEVAADGLSITFTLRDDVQYHDGSKFDASVVKLNLDRARGPEAGTAMRSFVVDISNVVVVNPTTVRVELSKPNPVVLATLGLHAGFMVSPMGLANAASLPTQPQGSGPYELVSATNDKVVLELSDDPYWNKKLKGKLPQRKEILYILDDAARLNAVKTGQADLGFLRLFQLQEVDQMVATGDFKRTRYDSAQIYVLAMNLNLPPFDKVEARQAVNYAINRDAINKGLLNGGCEPAQQISTAFGGQDPKLNGFKYDPAKARDLLAKAGVTNPAITLHTYAGLEPYNSMLQAIQKDLEAVGFKVTLGTTVAAQLSNTFQQGGLHGIVQVNIPNVPDPTGIIDRFVLTNPGIAKDPEIKRLADIARAQPLGPKRDAAWAALSKHLYDNPTQAVICSPGVDWVSAKSLKGVGKLPAQVLGPPNDNLSLIHKAGRN